jgi:hypothetical protein
MPNNEFDKAYRLPLTASLSTALSSTASLSTALSSTASLSTALSSTASLSPIGNTFQDPLLEVVIGRTLTFYTEETHIKLCVIIAKIREESAIIISKACKRTGTNRVYGSNIMAFNVLGAYVRMNNLNRIHITNIYAYKIQQFIKYAIDRNKYNKVKAIILLANRFKTGVNRNAYNHIKRSAIIIKNMLNNSYNYRKYKQVIEKVKVLQIRYKMHYNKRVGACVKIQLLWIRYNRMRKSVMAQNDILQKRNTYLENRIIELELQILKLNSSQPLVPMAPLVKHDKGTFTYDVETICTNYDVETIYTNYDVGSGHNDYIKVDVNRVDMDKVDMDNEIKIKRLEEDIKNIVDDRIKLLTVIDTITKENRTMYRHIQNSSKSWFSRIFN